MKTLEYTLEKDGFIGKLHIPDLDHFKGKVLIAFSGSDGIYLLSQKLAEKFQSAGLTTMALAYWNMPGLPESLENIPVEYLGKVSDKLKEMGYEKIGLWGISMGAEYALLAASRLPEKFSCVIACSPIDFVTQGLTKKKLVADGAAFSFEGKTLACTRYKRSMTKMTMIKAFLKNGEYTVRFMYDDIAEAPEPDSLIKAENIKGPILIFAGELDSMWPATLAGDRIIKRLEEYKFEYGKELYKYEMGSHYMVPMALKSDKIFKVERKHPEECARIKADIWEKTLNFIKNVW